MISIERKEAIRRYTRPVLKGSEIVPINLYKLIESKDIKAVIELLDGHEAQISSMLEGLPEETCSKIGYGLRILPFKLMDQGRPQTSIETAYLEGLQDSPAWAMLLRRHQSTTAAIDKIGALADDLHHSNSELDRIGEDAAKEAANILCTLSTGKKKPDPRLVVVYFLLHKGYKQREIKEVLRVSIGTVSGLVKQIESHGRHLVLKRNGSAAPHVGNEYRHNRSKRGISYSVEDVQDESPNIYETIDEDEWENNIWEN